MRFDWREFLNLAYFLGGEKDIRYSQESAYRSAVSRAYYAAFCYARNYARDNEGFTPSRSAKDHKNLREHFRRTGKIEIASKLEELSQWRRNCDYDDIIDNLQVIVENALKNAKAIIKELLNYAC